MKAITHGSQLRRQGAITRELFVTTSSRQQKCWQAGGVSTAATPGSQRLEASLDASEQNVLRVDRFNLDGAFREHPRSHLICKIDNIVRPITRLAGRMKLLASGDFSVDVGDEARRDEIGLMAAAVRVFKANGLRLKASEAEAERARYLADEAKSKAAADQAEAAAQQTKVVSAIAEGLERLSNGELTYRIETRFLAAYEKLRSDFNGAMGKLVPEGTNRAPRTRIMLSPHRARV